MESIMYVYVYLLLCIMFSTPGSCVDARTANDMKEYVTSVCLGSDIVCRLSVFSLATLREQVLDSIVRCKVNKYTLTKSIFTKSLDLSEVLYNQGEEPPSKFKADVEVYKVCVYMYICRSIYGMCIIYM